ncbi:MAG: preprotein translocase subunit SecG [Pyrinomonadaceae bacterium]
MIYVLYTLFVLSCLVIVISILLQPGKADAGALFTSSVSSTAFGPRGTQTLLAKITIIAAIVFMLSALLLSVPYFTGARSVLQSVEETPAPTQTTPAAPAVPPATTNESGTIGGTNSNAATTTNAGTDQKPPQSDANKQANQNKK